MPIQCVILDFDGTFTDVEQEAAPFVASYPQLVGQLLGSSNVERLWAHAVADVHADPQRHGWLFEGKVVAPGNADPYILATSASNLVFDWLGLLPEPRLRAAIVQTLYKQAYAHTEAAFRPHAREVLRELLSRGASVFVVSNADTATVKRKLDTLGIPVLPQDVAPQAGAVQLYGDARKFAVEELASPDETFRNLPQSVDLGAGRPIYVRRGNYYRVIREIWGKCGAGPASTLVCGDIYELDLALPDALGCQVHLAARPTAPEYERRRLGPGRLGDDLRSLLDRLS